MENLQGNKNNKENKVRGAETKLCTKKLAKRVSNSNKLVKIITLKKALYIKKNKF